MTAADEVKTQFLGLVTATVKRGWAGLRPKPGPDGTVFSAFLGRALKADEGQTLVEAVGSLVHEATLRIKPYRQGVQKDVPETVLGHSAAAHGTALDIAAMQWEQGKKIDEILALLKAQAAR